MYLRLLVALVAAVMVAVPAADAWSNCLVHIFRCTQCFFSGKSAKECSKAPVSSSAEFKFDSVSSFSCQIQGNNGCTGQQDCADTDKCELVALFVDGLCMGTFMVQQETVCCDAYLF